MNKLAKRSWLRLAALLVLCFVLLLLAPSGQHALVSAAPLAGPAASGVLAFDGTGDYVTFGAAPGLGVTTFTIELWFKREGTGTTADTGTGGFFAIPLVTKGRGEAENSNVDMNYFLGIRGSDNVLAADFEDNAGGTNHPVAGSTTILNDTWYHAAATYDGTTWKLYLNGNLETELLVGTFSPRSDSIQHAALATAMNSTGLAAGAFDGVMDEVRIWNVARTQQEIQNSLGLEIETDTGLIARWGLNEGSGTAVGDSTLSGNNGTLAGDLLWQNDSPLAGPDALQFDGANDFVTFGPAPGLGLTEFTLEVWFKRTGNGVGVTTGTGGITSAIPLLTKGRGEGDGTNVDMNYFLGIDAGSNVLVADFESMASSNNNNPVVGSTALQNDTWYHAAVTYDGSDMKLYLNGTLDGTANTGGAVPRSDSIQHAALATAMQSGGVGTQLGFFAGVLDEARIWSRARTEQEIHDNMGLEISSDPDLKARWGLNEGSGALVADSNGSGNNGTLIDDPLWVKDVPFITPDALQFDGVDDFVTFGAAPGLGVTEFTLEVWFKRTGNGVGVTTGTGGITSAIPLLTKGRGEGDGTNVDMNYFLGIDAGSNVLAADFESMASSNNNNPVVGSTVIENDKWYHAAVTYDGSDMKLYLNGDLDGTAPTGGATPRSDSIQHAALATAMQSGGIGTELGFFAGVLDEARVWNYARTEQEIKDNLGLEIETETGLLARWGLNEGTGTAVGDSTGNGIGGTIAGNPVWVEGAPFFIADALDFDGTGDYVTFGAAPDFGVTKFTIELWFKREGTGTTASTGNGGIAAIPLVTKGRGEADGDNRDMNYFFGIQDSNDVLAADFEDMATGLNHPVAGSTTLLNDTWYHAAATYDGTTWKLYLNGNLETELLVGTFSPRADSIQHAGLATAMTSTGAVEGSFDGVMDEVRIWNYARTQQEIKDDLVLEIESDTGLIARWGLNEGTGTAVGDTSGNGIGGTIAGNPVWVEGAPFFIPDALDFDGAGDYVTFGPAPGLGVTTFTTELWFKREGAGTTASTGNGGIAAIPLVTKGRGEADGDSRDMNFFFGIQGSNNVLAADFEDMATGLNHPVAGSTSLQNDTWYHAAATYDGTTWKLYLNGNLETELLVGTFSPRADSIQHAGLATAMTSTGATEGSFDGVMDEVRVWNYARTQQQIQDNLGLEIESDAGLIARWGLNEGSGTAVGDSTGSGNDGTIAGNPVWVEGAPFDAPVLPTLVTLQDGVDGYTGTRDTYIYDVDPATPRGSEITMVQDKNTGDNRTSLLSFDLSSIPAGAAISSAELQFYVDTEGQGFNMHRMLLPWDEATVTFTSLGGRHFAPDDTDAENLVNASWPGVDTYTGYITVPIPASTIQDWIDGTLPNNGWLMIATHADDGQQLRTREHAAIADRPRLAVSYTVSALPTLISFQEGVDSYAGTFDAYLQENEPDSAHDDDIDLVPDGIHWDVKITDVDYSAKYGLLRFDNIFGTGPGQIPPGATIESATLTYQAFDPGGAANVNEVLFDWDETITYNGFGAVPGVQADDYGASVGQAPGETGTHSLDVTNSLFAWSLDNTANHGWLFRPSTDDGTQVRASEYPTLAERPRLSVSYTVPTGPPNSSTDLLATALTIPEIELNWTDHADNEAIFQIERSTTGPTGSFSLLTTTGADVTTYTDQGLATGTQYCYQVRAVNGMGPSADYTDVACDTTTLQTNYALDFWPSGAYVTFGNPDELKLAAFTVETWFKRQGAGVRTSTGTNGIENTAIPLVAKGRGEQETADVDLNYFLGIDDSLDVLAADFEEGAGGTNPSLNHPVFGTTTIPDNDDTWHHAAATYDGATWKLYLDGNLETELAVGQPVAAAGNQHASIGSALNSTGVAEGFFDGVIDEARIWNRPLTQTEIQNNINTELTSGSGLVARWGLNEGTGTAVADSTNTYSNGTIIGSNWSWTAGALLDINLSPDEPTSPSPADSAVDVAQPLTLSVNVSDPEADEMSVSFYGRPANAAGGENFTIVALPDTQNYSSSTSGGSPAIFDAQTQWIVSNKDARNIVFVTHLGDIVQTGNTVPLEWTEAGQAMAFLEDPGTTGLADGIPYGMAVGNHDQTPAYDPTGDSTQLYNATFGLSRFGSRGYFGGYYSADSDNRFQLFSASGMDFIAIHLEIGGADSALLLWADNLLSTHSTRRAIVVTHSIGSTGNPLSFTTEGQAIYDALKDNPNLFLMLGGHVSGEGQRTDTYNGNTIHTLVSDYQSRTNGGNGWLRFMEFDPVAGEIHVQTYSPWITQSETDADSQFTLAYEMGGVGFELIGVDSNVASGSTASVPWDGLLDGTEYEWYAVVDDGHSTTTSPTWRFTTDTSLVTQNINLDIGWNMISSNVEPTDPNIEVILAPIVNDMVLIKNGAGQVYWPGLGNQITGGWNVLEGYKIYMTAAATLSITGTPLVPESTSIDLEAGWNMISYTRDSLMTSDLALASITGKFVLIKNNAGNVYWPDLAPQTIDMVPGQGYKIYMKEAATLVYPPN